MCEFTACKTCTKRWVMESSSQPYGDCANCRSPWSFQYLNSLLGKTFVDGPHREIRRSRLLILETPRLALSQCAADRERRRREIRLRISVLTQMGDWSAGPIAELRRLQRALNTIPHDARADSSSNQTFKWGVHCVQCTLPVSRMDGVCERCEHVTCMECGQSSYPGHVCDPNLASSIREISRNCKACPRCRVPTFRSEGCTVMWCSHCHAFWDWGTQTVIDSRRHVPHNPEHRQWLLEGGGLPRREIDDLPCGGLPDGTLLHSALMTSLTHSPEVTHSASVLLFALESLYVAQRLRHEYPCVWDEERLHENSRIAFLLGDCDERKFAVALERQERNVLFKKEIGNVLETFVLCGTDIFQRFVHLSIDSTVGAIEMQALRHETTTSLLTVGKHFKRTTPLLSVEWRWDRPYDRRDR